MADDDPYFLDFLFNNITDVHWGNTWIGIYCDGANPVTSVQISFPGLASAGVISWPSSFYQHWDNQNFWVKKSDLTRKVKAGGRTYTAFGFDQIGDDALPQPINLNHGAIAIQGSSGFGVVTYIQVPTQEKFTCKVDLSADGTAFAPIAWIAGNIFSTKQMKAGAPNYQIVSDGWPDGKFSGTSGFVTETFTFDPKALKMVAA